MKLIPFLTFCVGWKEKFDENDKNNIDAAIK